MSAIIQISVLVFLFCLTLMSVDNRWTQAEILLIRMLPSICVLAMIVLFLCRENLHLTLGDLLLSLFALYYILHSCLSSKYPCATQNLRLAGVFLLYISLRFLFSARNIPQWVLVSLLLFGGSIEAVLGIVQLLGGGSRTQVYMITGNFNNPGPYSAYLAIGAVTGLAFLVEKGRNKIVFLVVALLLAVIPSTWSRAAFISVVIPVLWLYRDKYYRYRYVVWGILALFAVAIYYVKKGSADGRLVIWIATLLSWRYSALTGVGTGGFAHSYSEGIAEMYNNGIFPSIFDSAGVADNAFNIFLKILVEQGVVGLILFLLALTVFFKGLYSTCRPLFYGFLALLLFSMFSYPLELLPYRIIAITTVAWSESRNKVFSLKCKGFIVIPVLGIAMVAGMFLRKETYDRYSADKEAKLLSCQTGEDIIDDYYDILNYEEDNQHFLYDFAVALSENGSIEESNRILKKGTMVSADPMFYVLSGNNYRNMNMPKQAEEAYLKAFYVLPNRIYPLYQLMLLYSKTNQEERAKIAADKILEITPKVASPATEEMKEMAKQILLR